MPYEIGHIKSYTPNSRRFDREPYIATIKEFIGSSEQFAIVYPKKTYKNDIFQRDLARFKTVVKEQDYKNIKIHTMIDIFRKNDIAPNRYGKYNVRRIL